MSVETISPLLPEHASQDPSSETPTGYNPDEETKELIKKVETCYKKAKRHKSKYDEKWMDYYKMFRGKQWKETRPSYRHSEVLNLVFQTIESMVPILTDSRPKLEYVPTIQESAELADILNKVAENDWEHNNWLYTLTEIIYDAHFYGTGMGYCGFDHDANQGLGNICFESADVFNIFPDPAAREINDKRSNYIVEAEPLNVSEVKKQYPSVAPYISADVGELSKGDKTDITQTFFKSPVDSKLYIEGSAGESSEGDKVLKITRYMKCDEVYEEDQGGEEGIVQKLKYPNGRKTVIASGVLCEDGPMTFDDQKFPFIKLTNYILPREFWGIGEVEPLEGPQKTINKLLSFTLDVMTLMGNPIWVVGSTANIDTDNLINKPGLIVETDDPAAVRREEGVQLQPFILELVDRYKQYIDGISGQTDLSRGATNGQVSAASAIQALQDSQKTRLRLKSRNVDKFLQDFGRMYMSRVLQFYSVPRIVRITGDNNIEQYFHFHVEKLDNLDPITQQPDGTTKTIANVTKQSPAGTMETMQYEIMGDFDVRVSTGSSLPFAKEEKTGIAMNLFKLGVIDDEELLKQLDYPNYEEVLRRVTEKKQAAQQAQMQAEQAQVQQQAQAKMAVSQQQTQSQAEIEKLKIQGNIIAKQASGVPHQ